VCALAHPWHVPEHAVLQHTPSGAHEPLAHWSPAVHAAPTGFVPTQVPPSFAVAQNEPVAQLPSAAQALQVPALQKPLWQSFVTLHPRPSAHAGQVDPPQSRPVSSASWTPSLQWEAVHVPCPSQTTPLLSVQLVPSGASVIVHELAEHPTTMQAVELLGQSAFVLHATHVPAPSQTVPL
jgi:hypothetical protein